MAGEVARRRVHDSNMNWVVEVREAPPRLSVFSDGAINDLPWEPFYKQINDAQKCNLVQATTTSTSTLCAMARPSISPDQKVVRTSVLLPGDVHSQVQALAGAHQVSSAWVIRLAVQRFLDQQQGQLELPLSPLHDKGSVNE